MSEPVRYEITPANPAAHLFEVELVVADPDPAGQALVLPAWIPGSYLIREFAKNVVQVRAHDVSGPVTLTKRDKDTWVAAPCSGPLTVRYEVYSWDLSVRMAHLDRTHGYFNGTSVFLRVVGQEERPHHVRIGLGLDPACQGWTVHTTLHRLGGAPHAPGLFSADDYDELIDHPVEMGTPMVVSFEACGVPHEVVLTGRHDADTARLARDLTVICEHHIRFFGEPAPMARYLFQVMVVGSGYGGLEHRASTSLICKRDDLPRVGEDTVSEGYRRFLGLCSHEYFHTWNVKRIKPAVFTPYDLNREGHTTLLWAFEGITSYYDDLGLTRSGLLPQTEYLELVGQTATRVMRGSGRLKQSLADSSFDAWTKFYRQDENAVNAIVSYYTKGALVALALDLTLRLRTDGRVSLDDVMGALWARNGRPGVGVAEDGIEAIAAELSGLDLTEFFDLTIRGTEDPPLAELLAEFGVTLRLRPAEGSDDKGGKPASTDLDELHRRGWLGADLSGAGGGAKVVRVYDGGAAQAAGVSAGDVIIAADGLRAKGDLTKRLGRLAPGSLVELHLFRRDELMVLPVTLTEPPATTAVLTIDEEAAPEAVARREAWLGAHAADD